MSETKPNVTPLPTIWNVPDELWEMVAKILAIYDPPKTTGRPCVDQRRALDGIIYRLRTGCQWNSLPAEFGNDVSVYRTFRRWDAGGIFDLLWALLLLRCEELGGVDWQWQAADGCLGKARGVPKKGRSRKPSVPIPPIGAKQVSRRACLSREAAVRLLSVSPVPMSMTSPCLPRP
jgi:transposase